MSVPDFLERSAVGFHLVHQDKTTPLQVPAGLDNLSQDTHGFNLIFPFVFFYKGHFTLKPFVVEVSGADHYGNRPVGVNMPHLAAGSTDYGSFFSEDIGGDIDVYSFTQMAFAP
jgi:hypothetical protein